MLIKDDRRVAVKISLKVDLADLINGELQEALAPLDALSELTIDHVDMEENHG